MQAVVSSEEYRVFSMCVNVVCSVQCVVYRVQFAVSSVMRTLCSVHFFRAALAIWALVSKSL